MLIAMLSSTSKSCLYTTTTVFVFRLRSLYGHPGNVDLWVGGMIERPLHDDALVGPTFACIIANQFYRTRHGDRFWSVVHSTKRNNTSQQNTRRYEKEDVFSSLQLAEIRAGASLSALICNNADDIKRYDILHVTSS